MANYPSSASTDSNLYVAVNSLATTLVGALTSSGGNNGADIEVTSTANFPSVGYITIDQEAIKYTSLLSSPPRFSGITRGADGTVAASHLTSSVVKHNVIADHHNVLKEEIKAIESDLITTNPRLKLSGGTMTGAIAMGTSKITGLGNGTAAQDAAAFSQLIVLQAPVIATSTTSFSTTSATFVDSNLSAVITPTSTSSRILIFAVGQGFNASTATVATFTLSRGSTDLASGSAGFATLNSDTTNMTVPVSMVFIDSPATTSATTYRVRALSNGGGTIRFGATNSTQVMILVEVR